MAIEYALNMDTTSAPAELVARAAEALAAAGREEQREGGAAAVEGAGVAVFGRALEEPSRTFTREDFGIDASVRVSFRLDKDDLAGASAAMMRAIDAILRACRGDALLLRDGEQVVLRRRGEELVLNASFAGLRPEAEASLTLPHAKRPL